MFPNSNLFLMHPELMAYTGSYSCSRVARIEGESLVEQRLAAGKSISEHLRTSCFIYSQLV
jgi:hypothetical protein